MNFGLLRAAVYDSQMTKTTADARREWRGAGVVITGGGSGVGTALAELFAAEGAKILLVGRDENKLRMVCEKIGGEFLAGDVGDSAFCERALSEAESHFGRLDALMNNAGVIVRDTAADLCDEDWSRTIRTNLDGVFYMSRGALRRMQKQKHGAIVNVLSTASLVGVSGLSAYCASKGGAVQLTRSLALECAADGVTVNAVCPGAIDSPMLYSAHPDGTTVDQVRARNIAAIPHGRLATPLEVARAALFLASEPHITGVMLPVDGGYTAQ